MWKESRGKVCGVNITQTFLIGRHCMSILTTRELRKIYGSGDTEVRALDGVNLSVERG